MGLLSMLVPNVYMYVCVHLCIGLVRLRCLEQDIWGCLDTTNQICSDHCLSTADNVEGRVIVLYIWTSQNNYFC